MTPFIPTTTLLFATAAAGFALIRPPALPLTDPAPKDSPAKLVDSVTLPAAETPQVATPGPSTGPAGSLTPPATPDPFGPVPGSFPQPLNPAGQPADPDLLPALVGGSPPAVAEPPAVTGSPFDAAPAPAPPVGNEVRVIRLKYAAASDLLEAVSRMYADGIVNIAADMRTNSLIIRASAEQFDRVLELVEQLDQKSNDDVRTNATRPADWQSRMRSRQRENEVNDRVDSILKQYQPSVIAPNDELLTELRQAIDEAFTQRQQEQLAEIEELTGRLQKLAQSVREREARRGEIINQRLAELVASRPTRDPLSPPVDEYSPGTGAPAPGALPAPIGSPNPGDQFHPLSSRMSVESAIDSTLSTADSLRQRIQQHSSTARRLRDEYMQGKRRDPSIKTEIEDIRAMLQQDAEDARLRQQLIRIQTEAAAAQFEAAEKKFTQNMTLAEKGVVSQTDLDQAKVEAFRSKSELQQIEVLRALFESIEQSAAEARQLMDGLEPPAKELPQPGTPTP